MFTTFASAIVEKNSLSQAMSFPATLIRADARLNL